MAKSPKVSTQKDLLDFLSKATKIPPQVDTFGTVKRPIQVATLVDYPKLGLTTFVTLGLSQVAVSSFRCLDIGFELTLTLTKVEPDTANDLANAVLENLRLRDSGERRPFIESNGIYAPGYPPYFLFTEAMTCTPKFRGQTRIGDRYVTFLAAIPLDDAELREYDQSVPKLIAKFRKGKRIADYPRR